MLEGNKINTRMMPSSSYYIKKWLATTDAEHLMKSAVCTHHPSKAMSAEDDHNFLGDTQYFRKTVSRSTISSTTSS